ncbi:MAG: hypothetical protein QOE29_731 [Gaiellaceae bacterium]|nr:hypothetical protein [Gaiellaceae bacterium]
MHRFHPAQTLERLGMARAAELARRARSVVVLFPEERRLRRLARHVQVALRERRGRRAYRVLSEAELRATKRSDTVFVFGAGGSLADIPPAEWERIAEHDTVAFSHFHCQRWIRVDYHLVAEVHELEETGASFRESPFYRETVFLVMRGILALASNEMVARRLIPPGARLFRYRRVGRGRTQPPSTSFAAGLVHGSNTSLDVVNFALLMGWKRIVVAGVDLYNRQYFFQPAGEALESDRHGHSFASPFVQSGHVIEMYRLWREAAAERGAELLVYDERSLLSAVLPVYDR